MCGTIKYEGVANKIGHLVYFEVPNCRGRLSATWLGHCRSEKGAPPNSQEVTLIGTSYTEKGIEFSIPQGYAISAYLIDSPNFPNGKGIFVRTRDATSEELKKCSHPRHPVLVKK